jgi:hypothetical protein
MPRCNTASITMNFDSAQIGCLFWDRLCIKARSVDSTGQLSGRVLFTGADPAAAGPVGGQQLPLGNLNRQGHWHFLLCVQSTSI